jgi:hypothetical protein
MTDTEDNDNSALPEIANTGADTVGAATGATLGMLVGGPGGAVVGAAVGPPLSHAFRKIGAEINNRYISPREDERIASALTYAIKRAKEKIDKGKKIRGDGFFDEGTDDRSTADEIVEGALIAAQREHEERKVEYIGYLIANICFDESLDGSQSNALIRAAERVSWRQMRIFSYLLRLQEFTGEDRTAHTFDPDSVQGLEAPPDDFLHEFSELQQMRLLMDLEAFMDFPLDLSRYVVSKFGRQLYSLMELERIEPSVLQEIDDLCKFGRYDT